MFWINVFVTMLVASDGYRAELLPPETIISILNGFTKALLLENERFEQLKSKCLEGAKLGYNDHHDSGVPLGSILKSSHTVLTYLSWGIRYTAFYSETNNSIHICMSENDHFSNSGI